MLAERCQAHSMPFQIGATHTSPQLALQRVRRAARLRPGALQVILADWYPLSDPEAIDCLARFAEAADGIGLVLYNPPHAKRVLDPEAWGRIAAAVPALVGTKVGGNDAWYAAMRQHAPRLSLFVPGHQLATARRCGAHGSYSNVACLSPAGAARWYRQMSADPAAALDLQKRLQAFFARYIRPLIDRDHYSNAAVDKLLAAAGDWAPVGTRLRWPYRSIDRQIVQQLRTAVAAELPELCP